MIALIDGDIVAYRCAASAENDTLEIAIARVDKLMRVILDRTQAKEMKTFLTGGNNFRKEINPLYKANRKDTVPPRFLQKCREFLVMEWGASVCDGYEADDALGFSQTEDTIICSIDKDLLMIPGKHFNFVREEFTEVSELEGLKAFYRQMLIGDTSDNVFGIEGIGKVKAAKLINHLTTEQEMFDVVCDMYTPESREQRHLLDELDIRFWMNADCLWIWRNEEEKFSDRRRDEV